MNSGGPDTSCPGQSTEYQSCQNLQCTFGGKFLFLLKFWQKVAFTNKKTIKFLTVNLLVFIKMSVVAVH